MEYVALALKYRPKNFDEVIGQEHIVTSLRNAILKKHIHHAYLFSGPRGVGKTSLARIFAKSLNCFSGPTVVTCEKCTSCVEINRGTAMDVIEIDAASNRGIDQIRQLREEVKLSPTYSRYKIYIIDEVHMLSHDAFNALLKTLEEPPAHVKFIFATTHPQKVLPTILSRCQKFQFFLVPPEKIFQKLKKIVQLENVNINDEILYEIVRASEGSLRDAESLLDQIVPIISEKDLIKDLFSFLGIIPYEITDKAIKLIFTKNLTELLELIDRIVKEGKDLGVFLNSLIEQLHHLLIAKATPAVFEKITFIPEISKSFLKETASIASVSETLDLIDMLINVKQFSNRLPNIRIPLELAFIRHLYQSRIEHNLTLNSKVTPNNTDKDNIKVTDVTAQLNIELDEIQDVSSKIDSDITIDATQDSEEDNLVVAEIKSRWGEIISYIQKKRAAIASHLSFGQPISSSANVVKIGFYKKDYFHKEMLEKGKNLKFVEETISNLFNKTIFINLTFIDDSTEKQVQTINGQQKIITTEENNKISNEHELINDILDTFGGTIDTDTVDT